MPYIRLGLARFSLFLSVILLAACAGFLTQSASDIAIPANDTREYRYLRLDNGLQVLLVSDPAAEKAAASLDVNVGSRQDPIDRQGLAHFLEHMLFLGTDRYPDPAEYQRFVSAHGGSHNAYTAFENTNYFFDVSAEHLEPALDRFSRFFVAPLFNSEYVQREVNAVDSEYRTRILNDQRRMLDVLKEVANPQHPFANFSVGNLATLLGGRGEASLRQALLDFYERYYSSNLMTLVVLGQESLDQLEAMVRPRFEPVANREVRLQPVQVPLFREDSQWVEVVPHQERRELSLHFPIPDVRELYRSKPFSYVGNILGHEGEGSLLSLLKARGWAESLSAGRSLAYQGGGMFSVSITLTEDGVKHAQEIAGLLFESIELIRREGIDEWRYQEQRKLGEQEFDFRTRPPEIREVSHLASNLQRYAASDVILGPYIMAHYQPALIAEMLDSLSPDNVLVTLTAPDLKTERVSEFYQTPYSVRAHTEEALLRWREAAEAQVSLPQPNPFIASRLDLKTGVTAMSVPRRLEHENGVELWFMNDTRFGVPRGYLRLMLETPMASQTAKQQALTGLWVRMVRDQLNEFAYPAQLAGLDFSVRPHRRGIEMTISGFDEKQSLLMEQLAATLGGPELDSLRFDRVRREQLRSLENSRQNEPFQLVNAELPKVLERENWPVDDLIQYTGGATLGALHDHVRDAMRATRLRILAQGNYTEAEAQELAVVAVQYLRGEQRYQGRPEQIMVLPAREPVHTVASEHKDSALLLYIQGREPGIPGRVMMGLAGQMLRSDFFHELRTEKQFGYVVAAGTLPQREVPGLFFLVQSSVANAAKLQGEFNDFIQHWLNDEQREDEFGQHKQALAQRLLQTPRNLGEASGRYWSDLLDGYTDFDSREQLVAELEALDFETWRRDLEQALGSSRRALWVVVPGQWGSQPLRGMPVLSLPTFKAEQVYHSFD